MPIGSKVIIASPNADFRSQIHKMLVAMHWPAEEAMGGADALNKIEGRRDLEAVLLDHWLPDLDVSDLEHSLRVRYPAIDVVLVDLESTEPSHSNRAPVHARTEELFWALRKRSIYRRPSPTPAKKADVEQDGEISGISASVIQPIAPQAGAVRDGQSLDDAEFARLPGMIGSAHKMARVSRLVRLVAPRKSTVLITGETGTGKEVVARALHELSGRSQLVIVNCAAIPETLLESELFGYSKGAFTGAMQPKVGRIQSADGGTLFLDEIGELPAALQAKLLRFLQEGEVQRLGSNEMTKVDVRVIAATNADLVPSHSKTKSENKSFRQDLYYRLAVFPIELPPLRDRRQDIPALAAHFLAHLCKLENVPAKGIGAAVSDRLLRHDWPGNVRELQHIMERAFILAQHESVITIEHLPALQSSELS
jgi:DNA-binding NtrC family response regulator